MPDTPRRLRPTDDLAPVHVLLTAAFAYMDGRIDPPSSLGRMGMAELAVQAGLAELWVLGDPVRACMLLTPQADTLYLGKLAVAEGARGRGLARVMVDHACARARALGLAHVTLQTRVELVENHATFARLGFVEIARAAHPGYDRPTSITYRRPV
jgi:ribosomal protein S18 acetylase RimI-like enzyme